MNKINIRNLGVGAIEINGNDKRILIDSFNSICQAKEIQEGDLLIFTHDDADHFLADTLPDIRTSNNLIIGPATIAKPIIERNKALIDQILVMHSPDNSNPTELDIQGVHITCYSTPHFNHWNPVHNSYLLEIHNRRIYITGDSLVTDDILNNEQNADYIICNLVDEDYLKGKDQEGHAIHHLMSYLLDIRRKKQPKGIIGAHLINFDRTVNPEDMKKLVLQYGFDDILIPTRAEEVICL